MLKEAYPPETWDELKQGCKEGAGWQCEYRYPNGKRCRMKENQIRTSKSGRRYIVYLHASHVENADPSNLTPSLVCLCAKHHMQMDRQAELCERLSSRRRGYQLTTTDNLLREVNSTGVTIVEVVDGYEWRIGGTDLTGKRTTAVAAVGSAIHQMRCLLETMQFPYKQAQEGETR